MEELGVTVDRHPFELHPELPPRGRPVRPDSALASAFAAVAEECARCGLPFSPPAHTPNTRLALETIAVISVEWPSVARLADDAISDARWIEGADISDRSALSSVLDSIGIDAAAVIGVVERGGGAEVVARSMDDARSEGIASTPSWRFENGFVIPGVQPTETVTRWVTRIRTKNP